MTRSIGAVRMLNANLDLAIHDFIAVSYAGLSKFVDELGGLWIDVSLDEQEQQTMERQKSMIAQLLSCANRKSRTTESNC